MVLLQYYCSGHCSTAATIPTRSRGLASVAIYDQQYLRVRLRSVVFWWSQEASSTFATFARTVIMDLPTVLVVEIVSFFEITDIFDLQQEDCLERILLIVHHIRLAAMVARSLPLIAFITNSRSQRGRCRQLV